MGSIAGHVASPLFSVYGATKFGLCSFIENLNVELAHDGYDNRILDVSPGSLKGTNFAGKGEDLAQLDVVVSEVLQKMTKNRKKIHLKIKKSKNAAKIEKSLDKMAKMWFNIRCHCISVNFALWQTLPEIRFRIL